MTRTKKEPLFAGDDAAIVMVREKSEVDFPTTVPQSEPERLALAVELNKSALERYDALVWYALLKNASSILAVAMDICKEDAICEMRDRKQEYLGIKLETRSVKEWEYAHPRIDEIDAEMKKLKDEKKKLQTVLESLTATMVDTKTGEVIEPAKLTRDGVNLFVTLPK
jgi:hypothetical protein